MADPLVSVVIATRDRPERLARLLDALRGQSLDTDRFEVVVVADGPSPPTRRLLDREADRDGLDVRVCRHPAPRGPAAARNSGWRAARGPVIAFTDDDCVPAADWLEAGLEAASPRTVVQGITLPDPADQGGGAFSRTVSVTTLGPQYETCNIFYPRGALESLGGFDERFGLTPGGEDTDLAWRAIAGGYEMALAPRAVVFHAVERLGAVALLRVAARWSTPMKALADHPEARTMLYRGVFWNVWHYLIWRSALALAAPSWLRRFVLTLHLVELRKRARRSGGGGFVVPFLIVHDLVECYAVARGALRYRTLVL